MIRPGRPVPGPVRLIRAHRSDTGLVGTGLACRDPGWSGAGLSDLGFCDLGFCDLG
jgi:hypothetical protein